MSVSDRPVSSLSAVTHSQHSEADKPTNRLIETGEMAVIKRIHESIYRSSASLVGEKKWDHILPKTVLNDEAKSVPKTYATDRHIWFLSLQHLTTYHKFKSAS